MKLTETHVIKLHEQVLRKYGGGCPGIRDRGLIVAAIARTDAGFGDEEFFQTTVEKAAALMESLVRNHPFIDGNKRCAFFAAIAYCRLNGVELKRQMPTAEDLLIAVAEKRASHADIVTWLENHVAGQ